MSHIVIYLNFNFLTHTHTNVILYPHYKFKDVIKYSIKWFCVKISQQGIECCAHVLIYELFQRINIIPFLCSSSVVFYMLSLKDITWRISSLLCAYTVSFFFLFFLFVFVYYYYLSFILINLLLFLYIDTHKHTVYGRKRPLFLYQNLGECLISLDTRIRVWIHPKFHIDTHYINWNWKFIITIYDSFFLTIFCISMKKKLKKKCRFSYIQCLCHVVNSSKEREVDTFLTQFIIIISLTSSIV